MKFGEVIRSDFAVVVCLITDSPDAIVDYLCNPSPSIASLINKAGEWVNQDMDISEMSSRMRGIATVQKLSITKNPELAAALNATDPGFILFINGQMSARYVSKMRPNVEAVADHFRIKIADERKQV
jgi:hypothetical protein